MGEEDDSVCEWFGGGHFGVACENPASGVVGECGGERVGGCDGPVGEDRDDGGDCCAEDDEDGCVDCESDGLCDEVCVGALEGVKAVCSFDCERGDGEWECE